MSATSCRLIGQQGCSPLSSPSLRAYMELRSSTASRAYPSHQRRPNSTTATPYVLRIVPVQRASSLIMLDPLTAVSLVAAILQFVDFGSQIIVSGYEIHCSTHGATEENAGPEYLTQRPYKFQDQLSTSPNQLAHIDQELQKRAQKCSYFWLLVTTIHYSSRPKRSAVTFAEPWIRYGADINIKVTTAHRRRDVCTCLLTKEGHWPGFSKDECERRVDAWLAGGRARRAARPLANSSETPKRPSLRARSKRLLA